MKSAESMNSCSLCARKCAVVRPLSVKAGEGPGACRCGWNPVVARAALHQWEEPCISGTKGSGTVFFSGCNLHCVFCQNYDISSEFHGKEIDSVRLREIYFELIGKGAHNINLVTPTHFSDAILESLAEPLPVPVVWNSNGYDTPENLRRLEGKVQVYLPDLKYSDNVLAMRCSRAPDYFEIAKAGILEMFRQRGPYVIGDDGLMTSGVVIRHLILPNHVENTFRVIDWVAEQFRPGEVLFSLMRQYIPCGRANEFPELSRKVTDEEYELVEEYLFDSGIEDGFVQEEESASSDFIPGFDGTGV